MLNHRINLSCSCHSGSEDTPERQPPLVSPSRCPCPTCQGRSGNPGALRFLLSASKDAPAPQKPCSACPGFQKPQRTLFPDSASFYFYSKTRTPWSEKPQAPFKNWQRARSQAGRPGRQTSTQTLLWRWLGC